jgi:hypothetical protein
MAGLAQVQREAAQAGFCGAWRYRGRRHLVRIKHEPRWFASVPEHGSAVAIDRVN